MGSPLTARILAWGRGARDGRAVEAPSSREIFAPQALTDEELLALLQTKHEPALAELFDRHARLVFGIAFRVLRDRGEAEELVQELFLHLMKSADRFDSSKGSARAWISHLAVHKAIDRRGFLQRRRFYDGTELETVQDSLQGASNAEASLIHDSLCNQLRTALGELKAQQRITLEWFFFEGCSLRDIAERLGETHTNVRHHFYRGLETLRRNPVVARLRGESS